MKMNTKLFTRILLKNFPQIMINSIRQIYGGWDSNVFEINNDLIFKFPKTSEIVTTIRKEIRLLPELVKTFSVMIPDPSFVGQHDGITFFGYRKLSGSPLASCNYHTLSYADQVAQIIGEIHSFPIQKAMNLDVPRLKWRSEYVHFSQEVKRKFLSMMDQSLQKKTTSVLDEFLDNDDNFQFESVFIHHDLSPDAHILCNPATRRVIGIIDWGDAVIGDPAIDFTGLYWDCGEKFTKRALAKYKGPIDHTFWERILFYYKIGGFYEIEYGLATHDEAHVQRGLSHLSRVLQQH